MRCSTLLIELRRAGKQVVGYGAPGKGNTLLNYCGIRTDFLDYTVDRNPYKHGRFTPGTHIPIHPPERIAETRPDAIVILPWNLAPEISAQLAYTAEWGAKLIVPIPTATLVEPGSVHKAEQPREHCLAHARPMRPGERPTMDQVGAEAREGRHLLWRSRRSHGRGDAAHPEADDRDRRPARSSGTSCATTPNWGYNDFILCLGYKGEVVKEYFLSYNEALFNDFVLERNGDGTKLELLSRDLGEWRDHVRRHRRRRDHR